MHDLTVMFSDEDAPRARLALLLSIFPSFPQPRAARILYPLPEVLLLVTCATIASCDDFDDIVLWGEHHLDFLRRFSAFHFGVPCARWFRILFNRIDPALFGRCFHTGSPRFGRPCTTSSPSTARRRGAPTSVSQD